VARRGVPHEVIDMLHNVPLFSGCNKKELRSIAALGAPVSAPEGTKLTEQGKPGFEFFLMVEGKAKCLIDGKVVAKFGPGDFFGEMSLLDRGPRHATVVADGPCEVLVLDGREFSSLLDTSPTIMRKMLVALAQRERANAGYRS
jgi:CRP/FNR family transcriptional regulator, cyclic AMP receptor protein